MTWWVARAAARDLAPLGLGAHVRRDARRPLCGMRAPAWPPFPSLMMPRLVDVDALSRLDPSRLALAGSESMCRKSSDDAFGGRAHNGAEPKADKISLDKLGRLCKVASRFMTTEPRTVSDIYLPDWSIHDPLIHLREFGGDKTYRLPSPPPPPHQLEAFLGTDACCIVRLKDSKVSRKHARLLYDDARWGVLDVDSRNGMKIDGHRQRVGYLGSGTELEVGGTTLIAESQRLIELREYLCRLLGWASERAHAVDLAVRAVRLAQLRRTPLVLRGAGELVTIAGDLHRRVFDDKAPFVVCAPHRLSVAENVTVAETLEEGLAQLRAARHGTLCVRAPHVPADYLKVTEVLRDPRVVVQLVVCDNTPASERVIDCPITIPLPVDRGNELPRLIEEFCEDAAAEFDTSAPDIATHRMWILRYAADTVPEIATSAHRLAALRVFGTAKAAAVALGMKAEALQRWLDVKGAPMPR
jgi:FHA domain